jgi:1-acyl-sn-glycerol-3-phosphate acyltransferase
MRLVRVRVFLAEARRSVCAGDNVIYIKKRKGFVHLALQSGAHLVPVYSFGENDSYGQVRQGEWGFWRVGMREGRCV